ncbi:centromere protein U isoform X1 [Hyperolius riggenbachi]|uniref:centromere protein U isoform X1 n=1 Tax=Hyperolius riggenbachi TaxID=752182 RepID=UPI0035A35846
MPPKKNKSTNKSQTYWRQSVVEEYAKDRASARKAVGTHTDNVKSKKSEAKKGRYEPLKNMVQDAEFSTILKEPGSDLQEDVCEESFNPPLHSTAVYSDDELLPESNKEHKEAPKMAPPAPAVSKRNSNVGVRQSRILEKYKTVAFRENSSTGPDAPVQQTRKMPQKPATELESSGNIDSQEVATEEKQQMSSTQSPTPEPAAKKMPQKTRQPIHESQSSENNNYSEVATQKKKQPFTLPEPALSKMPQKRTSVQELESSENIDSQEVATEEEEQQMSSPPEPAPHKKSAGKSKSADKKSTPNKNPKKKNDQNNKVPLKIWSPEDRPRTARDLNELDVVLYEFEKVVEEYRESIDTDVCRKAVDRLFLSFKELLISSIKDVQMLKDLKRKNAKLHQEIGRKQKRLIEIKDEVMKKRPRLSQLRKECSALEKKQDSLKNANSFLEKLQQLQADCRKYKARHSHAKEVTYGMSSLPALLLEAQSTMRAEHHFHYVNTQLQSMMGKQTEMG